MIPAGSDCVKTADAMECAVSGWGDKSTVPVACSLQLSPTAGAIVVRPTSNPDPDVMETGTIVPGPKV